MPRGTVHAFTNIDDVDGRLLVLVSPGGYHEGFLDEMGVLPSPAEPIHVERIVTIGARYGVELLPASSQDPGPSTTLRDGDGTSTDDETPPKV